MIKITNIIIHKYSTSGSEITQMKPTHDRMHSHTPNRIQSATCTEELDLRSSKNNLSFNLPTIKQNNNPITSSTMKNRNTRKIVQDFLAGCIYNRKRIFPKLKFYNPDAKSNTHIPAEAKQQQVKYSTF